jgi:hypothetical protein
MGKKAGASVSAASADHGSYCGIIKRVLQVLGPILVGSGQVAVAIQGMRHSSHLVALIF